METAPGRSVCSACTEYSVGVCSHGACLLDPWKCSPWHSNGSAAVSRQSSARRRGFAPPRLCAAAATAMDDYPAHSLDHNIPLLVTLGLPQSAR